MTENWGNDALEPVATQSWGDDPLEPIDQGPSAPIAGGGTITPPAERPAESVLEAGARGFGEAWGAGGSLGPSQETLDKLAPITTGGYAPGVMGAVDYATRGARNLASQVVRPALAVGGTALDVLGRAGAGVAHGIGEATEAAMPQRGTGREAENLANFLMLGAEGGIPASHAMQGKYKTQVNAVSPLAYEGVQGAARSFLGVTPGTEGFERARRVGDIATFERDTAVNPRSMLEVARDIIHPDATKRMSPSEYAKEFPIAKWDIEQARLFGFDPLFDNVARTLTTNYEDIVDTITAQHNPDFIKGESPKSRSFADIAKDHAKQDILADTAEATGLPVQPEPPKGLVPEDWGYGAEGNDLRAHFEPTRLRESELKHSAEPTMLRSGEAMHQIVTSDFSAIQGKYDADLAREITLAEKAGEHASLVKDTSRREALERAHTAKTESLEEARSVLSNGWKAMDSILAQTNHSDLATLGPELWESQNRAIGKQYEPLYRGVYDTAGAAPMPLTENAASAIKNLAQDMRSELPEGITLPAGAMAIAEQADVLSKQGVVNFEQLHGLYKEANRRARWDLSYADQAIGRYRLYSKILGDMLREPLDYEGAESWKAAADKLQKVNQGYGEDRAFAREKLIQQFKNEMASGMPPEPYVIANHLNKKGEGPRRRELIGLAEQSQKRQNKPVDYRKKVLGATMQRMANEARIDVSAPATWDNINGKVFRDGMEELIGENILHDLVDQGRVKESVKELWDLAQQFGYFNGGSKLDVAPATPFIEALRQAAAASEQLKNLEPMDAVGRLTEAAQKSREIIKRRETELKLDKLKQRKEHPLHDMLNDKAAAASARALLAKDNFKQLKAVVDHLAPRFPEVLELLKQEALDLVLEPLFKEVERAKRVNAGHLHAEGAIQQKFGALSSDAQKLLFGESRDVIEELQHVLRTIYGTSSGGMPGMSMSATLGGNSLVRVVKAFKYKLKTLVITHPEFARFLLRDFRKNPNHAWIELEKFFLYQPELGALVGAMQPYEDQQAREQGPNVAANLPQTPSWAEKFRGKPEAGDWRKEFR